MSNISNIIGAASYASAAQVNVPQGTSKPKSTGTTGGTTFPSDSVTLSGSKAASSIGSDPDHDGDVDKAGQPDKDSAAVSARAFQQQLAKTYAAN